MSPPVVGASRISRTLGKSYLAFVIMAGAALTIYLFFVFLVMMSDMDAHNRALNMFEEQFGRLEHPLNKRMFPNRAGWVRWSHTRFNVIILWASCGSSLGQGRT